MRRSIFTSALGKFVRFFLYFESLQAREHYSTLGKVSPEHHAMLSGMQRLLPATLENKLNVHYR